MGIVEELEWRGLIHDSTDLDVLRERLSRPVTVYCGFDPTADSLHIGHLVPLLMLRRFLDLGHRAIALAGGATGMVGDPSGRSSERNLLGPEELAANVASIKEQLVRLLGSQESSDWVLRDNATWTAPVTLLEFLRDVGKHVTVNQMVAKESVRARMDSEQGISFTEFSYMLLQANDFHELHVRDGCELQIGGSDQWGNIALGVDMVRRRTGDTVFGLTCPLITRSDGRKFGKSEGGAIWLDPAKTSPYQLFQWFVNVPDADVGPFLRKFTFLGREEIERLEAATMASPERREGQRVLATEVTAIVHGPEAAAAATEAAAILFGGAVSSASPEALAAVAAEVPRLAVDRSRLDEGIDVAAVLAELALVRSSSEARRAVDQGAAYVNNERAPAGRLVGSGDLLHDRWVLVRKGKRDYGVVEAA